MRMLLTPTDHHEYVCDAIDLGPKNVLISSYGIYAGITFTGQDTAKWGDKYKLETREVLDKLDDVDDVRLLIGIAEYASCKEDKKRCEDCEKKYVKQLLRLLSHADAFPSYKWRFTTALHLKCMLFFYQDGTKRGIGGGRNFTNSAWEDCTFELEREHIKPLFDHTVKLWKASPQVTIDAIEETLERQKIDPETLTALIDF